MFRTATGEDVVGEFVEKTDQGEVYKNTIQLVIVPSQTNQGTQSYAFAPFPHYAKPKSEIKITFPSASIVFYSEIESDFLDQYNGIFGNIVTPTPKFVLGK